MAGEIVAQLQPSDFFRETSVGYDLKLQSALSGTLRGLRLQKINPASSSGTPATPAEYLDVVFQIPGNLTMGTGLTFYLLVTDDGTSGDPGLVAKFGFTVKRLAADETTDGSASAGTEQTATVTLSSTASGVAILTKAIAAANLDSAAVGDFIAVRIRRMGADTADTAVGSVILLGAYVKNT
jgi:hypothetical protein